ncbi:MAG TPA: GNAT family N-acetyltransferase [Vicinamibacterales bacterium]|nr:GNAT family N-acetyltransferase [Vicinamibacterales bacterium]
MLTVLTRKFERNWEDYGLRAAVSKTLLYGLRIVYEQADYRLYRIDLARKATEAPSGPYGVEFRFVGVNDNEVINEIEHNSEWLRDTVRERLAAGAVCLAAFEDGALAGFNLVSFGAVFMPLVHVSRTFRDDEAWSEQIATVKTYRKKGLASQLRLRMFEELRRRGIRTFYGGARTDNGPSLGLARRVGFEEFVEIRYRRFLHYERRRYARMRDARA